MLGFRAYLLSQLTLLKAIVLLSNTRVQQAEPDVTAEKTEASE